jgi:hypothetical protein
LGGHERPLVPRHEGGKLLYHPPLQWDRLGRA